MYTCQKRLYLLSVMQINNWNVAAEFDSKSFYLRPVSRIKTPDISKEF